MIKTLILYIDTSATPLRDYLYTGEYSVYIVPKCALYRVPNSLVPLLDRTSMTFSPDSSSSLLIIKLNVGIAIVANLSFISSICVIWVASSITRRKYLKPCIDVALIPNISACTLYSF